jgi:hypothetical protein
MQPIQDATLVKLLALAVQGLTRAELDNELLAAYGSEMEVEVAQSFGEVIFSRRGRWLFVGNCFQFMYASDSPGVHKIFIQRLSVDGNRRAVSQVAMVADTAELALDRSILFIQQLECAI